MRQAITLIVNPTAGGGRAKARLPAVTAELERRELTFRTIETDSAEHARALGAEVAGRDELALTLGGDGLVSCVASTLSEAGGLLGVLPGGRGNDFARVLGIPLDDAVAALAAVLDGEERALDLAEIDGRPFIGIASGGFDSDANRIANETRLVRGNLVYAYGAIRALISWRHARFSLELDDRTVSYDGFSFAAANSKAYGGGMFIAPDADLEDGLLDIVITRDASKWAFLRDLRLVFEGKHVDLPHVEVFRTRELRVSADRPFTVYADGDAIADLPATVRVRPGALRALVPR